MNDQITDDIESQFGTANLDGSRDSYENFKVPTPDKAKNETSKQISGRLIPPIKSGRQDGRWSAFHAIHWGWEGVGKEPGRTSARPFRCVQRKGRDKQIIERCAACDKISEKEQQLKDALAALDQLKAAGQSVSAAEDRVKGLKEWLRKFNRDSKWYVHWVSDENKLGVLKLRGKAYDQLRDLVRSLQAEGKNPFSIRDGLQLTFRCVLASSPGGSPFIDSVAVAKEDVQVVIDGIKRTLQDDKKHPLTSDLARRALEVLPDLQTEVVRLVSPEQVQALVSCSGAPEEVDRILAIGQDRDPLQGSGGRAAAPYQPPTPYQPPVTPPATQPAPPIQPPAAAPVSQETVPATSSIGKLSDEEFEKMFASPKA